MLDFKLVKNPKNHEEWIETSLSGKLLLNIPQLNKGTAFTEEERETFGLLGKLPAQVETLEEQVKRAYLQYQAYDSPLQKNIYLNNLHDKNQVLFYKLISDYLAEMLPLIYTPIVGTAVKEYSREFRQARGLYIAYPYKDQIAEILDNRSHPEIDLIVVTDGEGILGIGDQGVGGMDIPIAKLMVYTLCAGINPLRTLPIMLDVGTNNQKLLDDPLYLGLRHKRIAGKQYDEFIANFIAVVKKKFPKVFLHWEDFGRDHAKRNLDLYRNKICSFNDDIQGTAAVTLAALLAASKANGSNLTEQRIVIYGAGTAGMGITDLICSAIQHQGLSAEEARKHFWLIDRQGLLLNDFNDLTPAQIPYARDRKEISTWTTESTGAISFLETIRQIKPTILIGCSARQNAFNKTIIETMFQFCSKPIIFPLSNPTENAEADPADLIQWTEGNALIATGSPFPPVTYKGQTITIPQCNNALVFPGIGLGIIAVKAQRLSDNMLWAACKILAENAPVLKDSRAPVLPPLTDARKINREIALAVARVAQDENLAENKQKDLEILIDGNIWTPKYLPLKKIT